MGQVVFPADALQRQHITAEGTATPHIQASGQDDKTVPLICYQSVTRCAARRKKTFPNWRSGKKTLH
jgi:hypothetical protein